MYYLKDSRRVAAFLNIKEVINFLNPGGQISLRFSLSKAVRPDSFHLVRQ